MQQRPNLLSALVVDDEEPARRRVAELLTADRDIGSIFEAEDGEAAVTLIRETKPDIVFLDVQMPDVDGFGVIGTIGAENMPLTVFVTAYDRFALEAFEADAVDYLLKPFGDERYERTMERVKKRVRDLRSNGFDEAARLDRELLRLVAKRSKPGEIWDWIAVRSRDTCRLLMAEDIDWIEAAGMYVTVHARGEEYLCRASIATLASRLDPFRFVRIHRSSIVNLKSVACLERRSHGEFDVTLRNGVQLLMTRTHRSQFEAILGQRI